MTRARSATAARRPTRRPRSASACRPSGSRTRRPGSPGRTSRATGPASCAPIPWVYGEIVRHLARRRARAHPGDDAADAKRRPATLLGRVGVDLASACDFFRAPTDRSWTRDYCPLFVIERRRRGRHHQLALQRLGEVPEPQDATTRSTTSIAKRLALRQWKPTATRRRQARRVVLEGGAIDVNGAGTMLTTEECLLDDGAGPQPGPVARGARARARASTWACARCSGSARHRRRRHPRPRRRPGAVRRRDARSSSPPRSDPDDANHAPLRENRARLETHDHRRRRAPARRDAADAGAGVLRRRAAAGELRELLHRQRRRCSCRRSTTRTTARRSRCWRALFPDRARRRHPRRRSGLGPRDAALHDAAGAAAPRAQR